MYKESIPCPLVFIHHSPVQLALHILPHPRPPSQSKSVKALDTPLAHAGTQVAHQTQSPFNTAAIKLRGGGGKSTSTGVGTPFIPGVSTTVHSRPQRHAVMAPLDTLF